MPRTAVELGYLRSILAIGKACLLRLHTLFMLRLMTDAPHPLTWEELCADPSLQDLPYRIELNGLNQIVMSPLPFRHGLHMSKIAAQLGEFLPQGETSFAAAITTSDNVKAPDVIWASDAFFREHFDAFALPVAPPLCVEVLSPTNPKAEIEDKRAHYFESGAQEVWICGLQGEMEFYAPGGQLARSLLCPAFPAKIEL